jgi:hypothetical protein
MTDGPFVLHQLRSLPPAPPYVVSESDAEPLIADAERLGVEVVLLDGSQVDDEVKLLKEIGKLLGFPSYFGASWDAFNDSVGDLPYVRERGIALFWRRADVLLRHDAPAFLTAAYRLQRASDDMARDLERPFEFGVILSGDWSFPAMPTT